MLVRTVVWILLLGSAASAGLWLARSVSPTGLILITLGVSGFVVLALASLLERAARR